MAGKLKPLTIKEYSGQQRLNISVGYGFNKGDQVAVIPYKDYETYVLNSTSADTEHLEELHNKIATLENENQQLKKQITNLDSEVKGHLKHIATIEEQFREETAINSNIKAELKGLQTSLYNIYDIMDSNTMAYVNGINNIINVYERSIAEATNVILNNVNNNINNKGFIKRITGFNIDIEDINLKEIKEDISNKGLDAKELVLFNIPEKLIERTLNNTGTEFDTGTIEPPETDQ